LASISDKGAGFRAVLGALAEFERSMILARTADGRKRAMDRGVRFGRKPKLSQFQIAEALQRRANGEPLADIARSYGVLDNKSAPALYSLRFQPLLTGPPIGGPFAWRRFQQLRC
jgi:hypothetical protein